MSAISLASAIARTPSLCGCDSLGLIQKNKLDTVRFSTVWPKFDSNFSTKCSSRFRASDTQSEKIPSPDGGSKEDEALGILEDVNYLWKLGAGSAAGAAILKYGSIVLPDITKPNILLALSIIFAPVVIALVLLFTQSYAKQ